MSRRSKALIIGAVLLLVLGGAGIAIALKVKHDNDVQAQHEAAQAAAQAAEEARQERIQQERQNRQILVTDMEKAITRYAERQSLQRYSLINGPILRTQCDPSGGHIDTKSSTQDFSCLAVHNVSGGTLHGYRFSATANYDRSSYSWRLGG